MKLWKRVENKESQDVEQKRQLWAAVDNILSAEGPAEFSAAMDELDMVRREQKPKWL